MIDTLAISGYRSIRELVLPLSSLTVITGKNGAGKSNLYRALKLISSIASENAIASIAKEGGITSIAWAGPENGGKRQQKLGERLTGTVRKDSVAIKLGFASSELSYAIDFGLPIPSSSAFSHDPEIKTETIWYGAVARPSTIEVKRNRGVITVGSGSSTQLLPIELANWESILSELDFQSSPEASKLSHQLEGWRFYDHIRTDSDSPARKLQVGSRTFQLAADGSNLASAVQTILELSPVTQFADAICQAFPGASVSVTAEENGLFALKFHQPGILRPLSATELSDGTLKFIALAAALLSPRPGEFIVLNEPENSLHAELIPALAELIIAANEHSQILVVTHSTALAEELKRSGAKHHQLELELGETSLMGQGLLDRPAWQWQSR